MDDKIREKQTGGGFDTVNVSKGVNMFTGAVMAWGMRFTKNIPDEEIASRIMELLKKNNQESVKEAIGCLNHLNENQRKAFLKLLRKDILTPKCDPDQRTRITTIFSSVVDSNKGRRGVDDLTALCDAFANTKDKQLKDAVIAGDEKSVKELLNEGANVYAKDRNGKSILDHASGNKAINDILNEAKAKIDKKLHLAILGGKTEEVVQLIESGADLNATVGYGSQFSSVCRFGSAEMVQAFIDAGVNLLGEHEKGVSILQIVRDDPDRKDIISIIERELMKIHIDLFRAVDKGAVKEVKQLIKNGFDVNAQDDSGKTSLIHAIELGRQDMVDALLDLGANVCIKDKNNKTALDFAKEVGIDKKAKSKMVATIEDAKYQMDQKLRDAIMGGEVDSVIQLIEDGADPNYTPTGSTMSNLYIACAKNDLRVVEALIEAGADLNKTSEGVGLLTPFHAACATDIAIVKALIKNGVRTDVLDADGKTPFMIACEYGKVDIINFLIEEAQVKDSLLNAKDSSGKSPLMHAIKYGQTDVVEVLIAQGANLNAVDNDGSTPFSIAYLNGDKTTIELLMKKGADVNINEISPLHLAATTGDIDKVRKLIAGGFDYNSKDKYGNTPLRVAYLNGHIDIVTMLIESGADVKTENMCSLLMRPDVYENPKKYMPVIWALVDAGVDLTVADEQGKTLWSEFIAKGNFKDPAIYEILELLHSNGADINKPGEGGNTSLHMALLKGDEKLVKFLIKKGAQVNLFNEERLYPLHLAILNGSVELVDLLIQNNAKLNAGDKQGRTPLILALEHGCIGCAKFLMKKGATLDENEKEVFSKLLPLLEELSEPPIVMKTYIDKAVRIHKSNIEKLFKTVASRKPDLYTRDILAKYLTEVDKLGKKANAEVPKQEKDFEEYQTTLLSNLQDLFLEFMFDLQKIGIESMLFHDHTKQRYNDIKPAMEALFSDFRNKQKEAIKKQHNNSLVSLEENLTKHKKKFFKEMQVFQEMVNYKPPKPPAGTRETDLYLGEGICYGSCAVLAGQKLENKPAAIEVSSQSRFYQAAHVA